MKSRSKNGQPRAVSKQANLPKVKAAEGATTERRYKRGYDPNHLPTETQDALKKAESTSPLMAVGEAVLTIASIPLAAAVYVYSIYYLFQQSANLPLTFVFAVFGYALTATIIGRQQRGLELMVHDASHGAWHRSDRRINNLLADIIVAYPVLSNVKAYWASHRIHHGQYGSHLDPCRKRFAEMGLPHLDLSTRWKIVRAVIRWLPYYNAAYYKEIGSQEWRQWAFFAAWHVTVFLGPAVLLLWLYLGISPMGAVALAFLAWTVFWMLPALMFLPVIRSIAESEEHDYDRGETEFETTYTNNGWLHRFLFHPKNDSYHLVHHMFPNIPERKHRRIHKMLMERDERYRAALHRDHVLDRK
jgi:fatty acid desaturase